MLHGDGDCITHMSAQELVKTALPAFEGCGASLEPVPNAADCEAIDLVLCQRNFPQGQRQAVEGPPRRGPER